jgi:hypothetical protein
MKIIHKKHILLLVIFVVLLYSCEKNNETSKENNNVQFLEQESTDDSENNEDKLFSDDTRELPIIIKPILPYKYDGYWSMRFGEYFILDDRNKDVDDNIHIPHLPNI